MRKRYHRGGAAIIEFAFVAIILFLLLFGIFEYARLIFVRQVLANAVREGARYAVVNTTDSTLVADTQTFVQSKVVGVDKSIRNYACLVYKADASGVNTGAAADATFGQYIAVQVDCDYDPILPSFLMMNSTIHISMKSLMYSEAN